MRTMKTVQIALAAGLLVAASALSAQAQANRTFVRSNGADTGACPNTAPCLSFQYAFTQTNAGGAIIALDSGGFGLLTSVTKAITIEAVPGTLAFIRPTASTAGVPVNAGSTDSVVLRNLVIDCQNAASSTGVLNIGPSRLLLDNVTVQQCAVGLQVTNAKASVTASNFSGNAVAMYADGEGWDAQGQAPSTAAITISGGHIVNNGTALFMANPGAGKYNIFAHLVGNSTANWSTDMVGNTTVVAGAGAGCPCFSVGYYYSNFGIK